MDEIADQIAKGIDAKRCRHNLHRGVYVFLHTHEITIDAMSVSYSVGTISSEYLEHIAVQKPREKRRLIREKIRQLRMNVNTKGTE